MGLLYLGIIYGAAFSQGIVYRAAVFEENFCISEDIIWGWCISEGNIRGCCISRELLYLRGYHMELM